MIKKPKYNVKELALQLRAFLKDSAISKADISKKWIIDKDEKTYLCRVISLLEDCY